MLGNFMKESGVVGRLVDVSQNTLIQPGDTFPWLSIGASMLGGNFLKWQTIAVFAWGCGIAFDTVAGVLLGN